MSTVTYAIVIEFRKVSNPAKRPADGYGNKIPTDWQVKTPDGRWRRVYAICHSNVASHYILVNKKTLFIRDSDFPETC